MLPPMLTEARRLRARGGLRQGSMAESALAAEKRKRGTSGTQDQLSSRGVRRAAVFGAVAFVLLAALAAWQLHRQIVAQRTEDARRAVQILEEHAEKVVGGYFVSLEQMEWLVRDLGPRAAAKDRSLRQRLRGMQAGRPEVQSIWLFDAKGDVAATSVSSPPPRANFAEREFFQSALRGEERHIGPVVFGRITKEYVFNLSRRLVDADGRFSGVLVLSLYPRYFRTFYATIGTQADSVELLRADGSVLARHPQPSGEPPTVHAPGSFMARLAEAPSGVFRATAPFGGQERLYAYRRLAGLPLYVLYGVAERRIESEWLQVAGLYAAVALPALFAMGFLGWTAYRQALAADRSREELRLANVGLEERVQARTAELSENEQRMRMMALEVDHRAKNLLASVQAIAMLTRADSVRDYVAKLTGRLKALSHAHALLSERRWSGAGLRRLAEEELAAFEGGQRVVLRGPDVDLAPPAAQALSMALHELATNAAKYGALSAPEGRVELEWSGLDGPDVTLRWTERDGPELLPPTRQGFGAQLIEATLAQQLGGEARFDWRPDGLVVELVIPTGMLASLPGEAA